MQLVSIVHFYIGYEEYGDSTKMFMELLIRKGIGLFVFALLTSFLIGAILHYIQVKFIETSILRYCKVFDYTPKSKKIRNMHLYI